MLHTFVKYKIKNWGQWCNFRDIGQNIQISVKKQGWFYSDFYYVRRSPFSKKLRFLSRFIKRKLSQAMLCSYKLGSYWIILFLRLIMEGGGSSLCNITCLSYFLSWVVVRRPLSLSILKKKPETTNVTQQIFSQSNLYSRILINFKFTKFMSTCFNINILCSKLIRKHVDGCGLISVSDRTYLLENSSASTRQMNTLY